MKISVACPTRQVIIRCVFYFLFFIDNIIIISIQALDFESLWQLLYCRSTTATWVSFYIIKLTDVSVHSFIADTISTETGTTGSGTVDLFYYKLQYFTELHLFQAWTWWLTMLQIYVTLWGSWFLCVPVCVSLLSTFNSFITLSTLQNPFDKHSAYFNQNGWF